MSTTEEKSTPWSTYFNITLPEDYSFLEYYKYRSKQTDFTSSFKKETHKLKKDPENLIKDGLDEKRKGASRLEEIRREGTHSTTGGSLEEESKLPLASDNKDSSKFIHEDVPAYWGVLDLTRESLYECREITENDLQQLSQDFANHVKWECEPAPINIQNYFDSHCEKLDNSDENKYFDTNVQFLKINMHSFQGMLTEEQLKTTSSFPLFNGIFTSNRMKHAYDACNEKSNPYKKSRMGRKVDMKVTLLKTPNKFEALFGEVAGGLGPFGVPTACRKKRFLDKLKLMSVTNERLEVIVYGWLQFGLELNFYAMDWRGSGVYRFGLLDRCRIPVDDNYCNILEDAYCILKLLEKRLLDTEISVNDLFLKNTRGKRRQIVLENKAELNITRSP
ncbi:796_t:CDS:2 [Paraglomus brasilianum]|uniref:796_t:CDS:1 n=1 Tax=Paraglomus brasilianum TaxID=144538 RepID=A0A9N9DGA7_9GLOM|nr:796_t:CDS:2 [Paraglomus brasilianum]